MNEKHYTTELSAFVNQELAKDDRQAVAEHLMKCEKCRAEHDQIKLGALLAENLPRVAAPHSIWARIELNLDDRDSPQFDLIPRFSFFSLRNTSAWAGALAAVSVISVLAYFWLFRTHEIQTAQKSDPVAGVTSNNGNVPALNSSLPANTAAETAQANANTAPLEAGSFWQFEMVSGSPKVGDASQPGMLAVGDLLETDARSRARIAVANIGNVEIAPNSRVKLVNTGSQQHRMSLERGRLHAKIFAPPRLFIVDTPTAAAVDLGCEYTLDVDKDGNSKLHVTGGFVALESGGRESIVPAGAMCLTKRGKGLGTPFSAEATERFKAALTRFDFSNGGSESVKAVLSESTFYDMITLWHLLSRVSKNDRGNVFDALSAYVKPPPGVTRDGVVALDKKMIGLWREEVENAWFE